MIVSWGFPTSVLFGAGAVTETGRVAREHGGTKALIVTDGGVRDAGLVAPVQA